MSHFASFKWSFFCVYRGRGLLYLNAPPGCGKTVLLYMKAKQWLNMGRRVHLVCISAQASAMSSLLAAQIIQSQVTTAAVNIHTFDFHKNHGGIKIAVNTLAGRAVKGDLYVIVDEADSNLTG